MANQLNPLKIIHCADLHIGAPLPSDQGDSLLALRLVLEAARRRRADLLLFAGDVLEADRISPGELEAVARLLQHYQEIPMVAVTGNHDPLSPGSPWKRLQKEGLLSVSAGMEQVNWRQGRVRIWCTGFNRATQPEPILAGPGLLQKQNERTAGIRYWDIGLAHGDLGSGDSLYNPLSTEDIKGSGLDYLALGHIHKPSPELQWAGQTPYAYSGSPLPFRFGDEGPRGAYEIILSPGQVRAAFLPLSPYAFRQLSLTLHEPRSAGLATVGLEEDLVAVIRKRLIGFELDYYALTLQVEDPSWRGLQLDRIGHLLNRQGLRIERLEVDYKGRGLMKRERWIKPSDLRAAGSLQTGRTPTPTSKPEGAFPQPFPGEEPVGRVADLPVGGQLGKKDRRNTDWDTFDPVRLLTDRERRFADLVYQKAALEGLSAADSELAVTYGLSFLRGEST